MAGLAYLLPPLSGLVALLAGRTGRVRLHGIQAVVLGALWPAALYAASALTPGVTQVVFAAAVCCWLVLAVAALVGADLWFPGIRRLFGSATETPLHR